MPITSRPRNVKGMGESQQPSHRWAAVRPPGLRQRKEVEGLEVSVHLGNHHHHLY